MITTVGKLFEITYGQKEYHNKEWLDGNTGNTILISAKGENNGVYGFFDIPAKFKVPIITVQGYGTIGHAFVQDEDCAVDDHMLILIPKGKMSMEELYQVAFQIRLTKWKYRYGRGITPTRLKDEKIKIIETKLSYDEFATSLMPKATPKSNLKKPSIFKDVPISDLCNIERKYYSYMEEVDKSVERTPYVTTTEYDNGAGMFCNEAPIFGKNSVSVSLDGRSGLTFFQTNDFIAGEKTAVLTSKEIKNKSLLIYIGTIIRTYGWRYSYGRKLSVERLEKMTIPMPLKGKNYDLDYIDNLVKNSYGFDKLKASLSD
ncbi:MAG TPA: restriction endonuclease subunit S [Candidatus Paceibacterota bacterium]